MVNQNQKGKRSLKILLRDFVFYSLGGALSGLLAGVIYVLVEALLFPNVFELYILDTPSLMAAFWNCTADGFLYGFLAGAFHGITYPYWNGRKTRRAIVFWSLFGIGVGLLIGILAQLQPTPPAISVVIRAMIGTTLVSVAFGAGLGMWSKLLELLLKEQKRCQDSFPSE